MGLQWVWGPADAVEFADEIPDLSAIELEDVGGIVIEVGVVLVAGCPGGAASGQAGDDMVSVHGMGSAA